MAYNELEEGFASPATLNRKQGARYLWKKNGRTYVQQDRPLGKKWEEEALIDFSDGEEILTGQLLEGKPVYQKYLKGVGFTSAGGYAKIPHGIPDPFTVIEAWGWVDYGTNLTANLYAIFFQDGFFRGFWGGALDKPWRIVIRYTKG